MSGIWLALPAAVLGFMLWSPSEYVLHRFGMHARRGRGPIAGEHRRHHRDPDATALHMRMLLHLSVYALAALAGLGLALVLPTAFAVGLTVGFAIGFAAYEILHWRSHHREPRWRYTIWLRRHHLGHHRHAGVSFGVTTALWDGVFGTSQRHSTQPKTVSRQ